MFSSEVMIVDEHNKNSKKVKYNEVMWTVQYNTEQYENKKAWLWN